MSGLQKLAHGHSFRGTRSLTAELGIAFLAITRYLDASDSDNLAGRHFHNQFINLQSDALATQFSLDSSIAASV